MDYKKMMYFAVGALAMVLFFYLVPEFFTFAALKAAIISALVVLTAFSFREQKDTVGWGLMIFTILLVFGFFVPAIQEKIDFIPILKEFFRS